jgi:hypothetical protein
MKKVFAVAVAVLALSSTAFAAGKFKVDVKAPASAKKGEKTTVPITFKGEGEFHFNTDYPFSVKLTAPAGVKLEKDTLKKEDAKEWKKEGATVEVAFTSADAGKKEITGEAKFAVCTEKDCAPQTQKIAINVEVK